MALTVETGTGSATADALISVDYADDYHAARGNTDWTGSKALKEAAIRRATNYISTAIHWMGTRTRAREQALSWPRAGVVDREGYGIASDTIPVEIKAAVAEIALREFVTPGMMTPDFTASAAVKREKVGDLEVEYLNASTSAEAVRPVLLVVNDLIGQFVAGSLSGVSLFANAERA